MPRLVLLSDTHEMHDRVKVPDGDILVFAGDMSFNGRPSAIRKFNEWLRKHPHPHKFVIAGNHDRMFEFSRKAAIDLLLCGNGNSPDDTIHYLENESYECEGLKFFGSPQTPAFHDWAFNVDRALLGRHWEAIPDDTDVLITHGPPLGILDQASPRLNTQHLGDYDLRERVKAVNPQVHVFGHIHGGAGYLPFSNATITYEEDGTVKITGPRTKFFNASVVDEAYSVAHEPSVIDLNPSTKV